MNEEVMNSFRQRRKLSVRKASQNLNVAKINIWRKLRKHHLRPFHYQPVQGLQEDICRRLDFCRLNLR